MTDELKSTLLSYFTGTLKMEPENKDEVTKEIDEILYSEFSEYLPDNLTNIKIYGMVNVEKNNTFVFYGYWQGTGNLGSGIIIVTDDSFQVLKVYTKYNNGVNLRCIYKLQVDEDGTFYGIDGVGVFSHQDTNMRFIMLNDFTSFYSQINDYFLDLRKSYILPENCQDAEYNCLYKNPNYSQYFFSGEKYTHYASGQPYPIAVEFKINVGLDNEWNVYSSNSSQLFSNTVYSSDTYVEFNSDNELFFETLAYTLNGNHEILLITKQFNSANLEHKKIIEFETEDFVVNTNLKNQSVFKNKNELLFVLNNSYSDGQSVNSIHDRIVMYYYNIEKNNLTKVYDEKIGYYGAGNINGAIFLCKNNNDIYILYLKDKTGTKKYNIYYFRYENAWNPILITDRIYSLNYQDVILFSMSKFNLLQLCVINSNLKSILIFKEDYNSINYNSSCYINKNSLNSNKVEIFSNNSLVFARNLYNKSINSNTTTSVLEIPNTYLNNKQITSTTLFGETNLQLLCNKKKIIKNIYETLYLNFINSFMIIDENNPNNKNLNSIAATYLNHAINSDCSYNDARLYKKAIVNYIDNTNKEVEYKIDSISETLCNLKFNIYIDKAASSISFISNDNTTVYHTIDISNLELNKYYKINQKLEVT